NTEVTRTREHGSPVYLNEELRDGGLAISWCTGDNEMARAAVGSKFWLEHVFATVEHIFDDATTLNFVPERDWKIDDDVVDRDTTPVPTTSLVEVDYTFANQGGTSVCT